MSALIPLRAAEVLAIHNASIERFGGAPGVRDEGLLESALAQPFQSFGDVELYPSHAEKAARYAFGIISNHPFCDANKRTGAAVMGAFLRMNGASFKPRADELLSVVLGTASGSVSYRELAAWISSQIEPQ